MAKNNNNTRERVIINTDDLEQIIKILKAKSYTTIGPTLREKAIIYDEIQSLNDLPIGLTEKHEAGYYRLEKRDDQAYFGYNVGPQSWKKFLSPPEVKLWSAKRSENGFDLLEEEPKIQHYAFIGIRSCDLNAIQILDNVFLGGPHTDNIYGERRRNNFILAVNCTEAGGTCFCASMGTGPKNEHGFDLALTEILDKDRHYFVVDIGTELGKEIIEETSPKKAKSEESELADKHVEKAANSMGRQLDTERLHDLLFANFHHPEWKKVADRCLSCANCTMVCPTCFCHTIEESTNLEGNIADRTRRWDSCFTLDFSYIHGGSVRKSTKSRYRQWMTHKLASWHDQFGTSGCVGCGRCITWCPVGIDITEIANTIRKSGELPENTVGQPN